MKKIVKYLSLLLLLTLVLVSCTEEEIRYLDPMIGGICDRTDDAVSEINSGSWNSALIGFRAQRLKLLGVKDLIENDGYTGENYTLADEDMSLQRVNSSLQMVEFKIDSVWNVEVKDIFSGIDKNSAGIVNFGTKKYNEIELITTDVYTWILSESDEDGYASNDLAGIKSDVDVLVGLAALNEQEVTDFVNELKDKYTDMLQQYADLESEVSSAPYFSKAQKAIYTALDQRLTDLGTTIEQDLSLSTKDQQDLVDRDLSALVYFVDNNYTSPAQTPLVWGEISSITELRWFSEVATEEERTGDWALTIDIDAAETHRWNPDADGPGFQQIQTFNGTFDGQFHIIHGIFMTKYGGPAANRAGLFHNLTGTLKNLGMVNAFIPSNAANGGQGGVLIGFITNGTVKNCFAHGIREPHSQAGGFVGRTGGAVVIEDCFSAVDFDVLNFGKWPNSGSFIGLPVAGPVTVKNCYTIGFNSNRAIFGYPVAFNLVEASGIYYDSESVGTTTLDRGPAGYDGASPFMITDDGVVTDLPVSQWSDLGNFTGFSSDVWEIKTVPEIDANPRPYLKGFNYEGIADFIVPEQ